MKVIRYLPTQHEEFISFLKQIPFLNSPDQEILNQAWALFDDDDNICAMISHEGYEEQKAVLVRYFLFRQKVDFDDLAILFHAFLNNIKEMGFLTIYTLIENPLLYDLFTKLSFTFIDEKNFILNEISAHNYTVKVMALIV